MYYSLYKCNNCDALSRIEGFDGIGDKKCQCGGIPEWYRSAIAPGVSEEAPKHTLNFIPPWHGYVDYGLKGAPRHITSKREIEEICKREGKVWGGDKELDQQCDKNKANNEREYMQNMFKGCERKLHEALRR